MVHAASRDDHRPLRRLQALEQAPAGIGAAGRPVRGHPAVALVAARLHVGDLAVDLAFLTRELQVHGPRAAGGRLAERARDEVREALDRPERGVELGVGGEGGQVVGGLVEIPVAEPRRAAAGHRDHRRARQVRVAEPGREVQRADLLGHAHPRPARHARVAVRHVRGRLLPVGVDDLDTGAPLQLRHAPPQHRGHHEHVRDAVGVQHLRQHPGAARARHPGAAIAVRTRSWKYLMTCSEEAPWRGVQKSRARSNPRLAIPRCTPAATSASSAPVVSA